MTRRRTHRRAGGRYGPLPPPSIYDDTLPCGCVIDRNGDDLFVCADHRPRRPIPFYEPPGGARPMMTTNGAELIAEERQRQIHVEGWTMLHDVLDHAKDELVTAARCYRTAEGPDAPMPPEWPWEPRWWKPKDRERNLVRSGALLQAEIDVLHTVYEQSRMKIAELTAERDAIAAEIDALRAARSRREATK